MRQNLFQLTDSVLGLKHVLRPLWHDHANGVRDELYRNRRVADPFAIGLHGLALANCIDRDAVVHGQGVQRGLAFPRLSH